MGGENYHTDFDAWDYLRGHESDPWRTRADPRTSACRRAGARGGWYWRERWLRPMHDYDRSRTWFRDEADFPGPRTMAAAADWIAHGAPTDERFFLFVDEFDPHEPFDTPEPWASRYDPTWPRTRNA